MLGERDACLEPNVASPHGEAQRVKLIAPIDDAAEAGRHLRIIAPDRGRAALDMERLDEGSHPVAGTEALEPLCGAVTVHED